MSEILFDLSKRVGKIKPVWGVNGGPANKVFTFDSSEYFKEAHIPSVRLHDIEYPYGSGEFIDIPCIFKDFDKDECDPANYNFALSDLYIQKIKDAGSDVLFRLGVSIEHAPVKRHVFPPKDFKKWASICEHIIRHYNEGFAEGFNFNIRYWEIWNEADGGSNMWVGKPEEYYELYSVAASHLKSCFPNIKIGGGGFTNSKNPFVEGFFEYISKNKVPLDFFSWHRYFTSIDTLRKSISDSEEILAKYGFDSSENIFDEWNYMENWKDQGDSYLKLTNEIGASYCGAVLSVLQKSSIDIAHYFEADVSKEWCGLFKITKMAIGKNDRAVVSPRKPYAAFKKFGEMASLKHETESHSTDDGVYTVGAYDGSTFDGMISFYGAESKKREIKITGLPFGKRIQMYVVNKEHDLKLICEITSSEDESIISHIFSDNELYLLHAE